MFMKKISTNQFLNVNNWNDLSGGGVTSLHTHDLADLSGPQPMAEAEVGDDVLTHLYRK